MNIKTVSIIGLGYIGLPTAAIVASKGVKVIGVDVSRNVVKTVNKGQVHIVEEGLEKLVRNVVKKGNLIATTKPEPAEIFIIAVPTPLEKRTYKPDLSYIESASRAIAPKLRAGNLVILESTSPVGTTEKMAAWLQEERPDLSFPQEKGDNSDIRIAYCPERVIPGNAIKELKINNRVIGGLSRRCGEFAEKLYRIFVQSKCTITDSRTAELCKLTENSFRDVNIAFANEMSKICEKFSINVWELIEVANLHPRVDILNPGPGVGGHCIAVDPWFLVNSAPEQARLVRMARKINDTKPDWVIEKTNNLIKEIVESNNGSRLPRLGIAGLTFKQDIDDLRESPAVKIAESFIIRKDIKLQIVEPHINILPLQLEPCTLSNNIITTAEWSDILLILVPHSMFKNEIDKIIGRTRIVDVCGILSI